jgi:hypothetical protein
MRIFSSGPDTVHNEDLPAKTRAYFSSTGVRLREEVWLRVEARWVADGAPLKITICRDNDGHREVVKELDGQIKSGEWEQKWTVELGQSVLDDVHGPIHLWFEAKLDGDSLPVRSQLVLVHRTRFSS